MNEPEPMNGDLICPKLRERNGGRVQDPRQACARCRICVDGIAKVPRVGFPVHRAKGFRGPGEDLQKAVLDHAGR